MNAKTFNENYEIDRKARTPRAVPKHLATEPVEITTADGAPYNTNETYFFFDAQAVEVRTSTGLRCNGEHLCAFGLKVVAIAKLRLNRDDALADGQAFFASEINRLHKLIQKFELEKSGANRSLKTFLMAKE